MKSVLWDKPKVNVYIDLTNADLTTGIHIQIDAFTIAKSVNNYVFHFITETGVITCCNYDAKHVNNSLTIEIHGGNMKYTLVGDLLTGEEIADGGSGANSVEKITGVWELDTSDPEFYYLNLNINKTAGEIYELSKNKIIMIYEPVVPDDILEQLNDLNVDSQRYEGHDSVNVVTGVLNDHGYITIALVDGQSEPIEYNHEYLPITIDIPSVG